MEDKQLINSTYTSTDDLIENLFDIDMRIDGTLTAKTQKWNDDVFMIGYKKIINKYYLQWINYNQFFDKVKEKLSSTTKKEWNYYSKTLYRFKKYFWTSQENIVNPFGVDEPRELKSMMGYATFFSGNQQFNVGVRCIYASLGGFWIDQICKSTDNNPSINAENCEHLDQFLQSVLLYDYAKIKVSECPDFFASHFIKFLDDIKHDYPILQKYYEYDENVYSSNIPDIFTEEKFPILSKQTSMTSRELIEDNAKKVQGIQTILQHIDSVICVLNDFINSPKTIPNNVAKKLLEVHSTAHPDTNDERINHFYKDIKKICIKETLAIGECPQSIDEIKEVYKQQKALSQRAENDPEWKAEELFAEDLPF